MQRPVVGRDSNVVTQNRESNTIQNKSIDTERNEMILAKNKNSPCMQRSGRGTCGESFCLLLMTFTHGPDIKQCVEAWRFWESTIAEIYSEESFNVDLLNPLTLLNLSHFSRAPTAISSQLRLKSQRQHRQHWV